MSVNIPYSVAVNAKEFLAGMVAEQASRSKDQAKAAKDISSFIGAVDKDLREAYDKYIPNVHVVSVENFANIVANRISLNPERFFDEGSDTSIAIEFSNRESKEYKGLHAVIKNSIKAYHDELLSKQGGMTNPVAELNKLSSNLFKRTRKLENAVSARVLGVEFSSRINAIFGNKAVLAAIDPRLGSSDTTFVFFSSSFNSITSSMRDRVYKEIQTYLRDVFGPDALSTMRIGNVVNTGHAAVISDVDSFVNTPAFAAVMYGVGSGKSSRYKSSDISKAAEVFKEESRILDNKITVDKEFTSSSSGYGVLLALGVTFTNIEDADLNSFRGYTYEKSAVSRFDIAKPAAPSRSTLLAIQRTLMRVVFRNNPALAKSSRNMVDFVKDAVFGEIVGKRTHSEKTTKTVRETKTVKKQVRNSTNSAIPAPSPNVVQKKIPLEAREPSTTSLTKLQTLINYHLHDVISANMGDGSATDVLNFRTGRFATSVQVEYLTQGRSGMITAFYSYMKYPYATFSAGGRQQNPRSRDPKLLIAKSIREIASQHVSNQLRSVNI